MATKAELRRTFVTSQAPTLAKSWNTSAAPWTTSTRLPLSKRFAWFSTQDELIVVGSPVESQRDLDLGLAYGIAHAVDRELVLMLPEGTDEPTRIRAAWLDIAVRVAIYDAAGAVTERPRMARHETLVAFEDAVVGHDHQLGDREDLVARLTRWADTCPELVPAHRSSYLAWHCDGRMVLRVKRTRGGVRVSAGVHATSPGPLEHVLTNPVSPDQFHELVAAASKAIVDRIRGADPGHAEHRLQERLASRTETDLGLFHPLREFPAVRPVGNRGYIDLLCTDHAQRLHVVETKIGPDPMLVLQGLDYWLWTKAHLPELRSHLHAHGIVVSGSPVVHVDYVVAPSPAGWLSPYTAAQLEALVGEIAWRVHRWDEWNSEQPTMTSHPKRQVPGGIDRAAEPGFVQRAERALTERAGS